MLRSYENKLLWYGNSIIFLLTFISIYLSINLFLSARFRKLFNTLKLSPQNQIVHGIIGALKKNLLNRIPDLRFGMKLLLTEKFLFMIIYKIESEYKQ